MCHRVLRKQKDQITVAYQTYSVSAQRIRTCHFVAEALSHTSFGVPTVNVVTFPGFLLEKSLRRPLYERIQS